MCTVSWIHQDGGYQLLCNRDEKRSRAHAFGPEIKKRDGVLYLTPTDQTAGGTWIGTNEFGVSVCLLNGPPSTRASVDRVYRSRGLLIPELLSAASLVELSERVWEFDLSSFAPFSLAILETGQYTTLIEWDGQEKTILPYAEPYMPLVSSSFHPEGVQSKRRDEFHRMVNSAPSLDAGLLAAFHTSHGAGPDAYSPCMHRPDAETVSFSWVSVTGSEIRFSYAAGAPCRQPPVVIRNLPRLQ